MKLGDLVTKKSGSKWTGRIVGSYRTELTPVGWCVESLYEQGSVQIYPEAALELLSSPPLKYPPRNPDSWHGGW